MVAVAGFVQWWLAVANEGLLVLPAGAWVQKEAGSDRFCSKAKARQMRMTVTQRHTGGSWPI